MVCWCVLQTSDRFNNAASIAVGNIDVDDPSDRNGKSGSITSPRAANTENERLPFGIHAAKQTRFEDANMEKMMKVNTVAVKTLAVAVHERCVACFFGSAARNTREESL